MRGLRWLAVPAFFVGAAMLGGCVYLVPVVGEPPPTTTTTTTTSASTTTTTTSTTTTTVPGPVIVDDPEEELISVGFGDVNSDGPSALPAISTDARYVAFRSTATNLLAVPFDDAQPQSRLYVRDRDSATTTFVADDGDWPALSADGRFVSFTTPVSLVPQDTDDGPDVYLYDQTTGSFELISVSTTGAGSGATATSARNTSLSADGRYVAFESDARNLVDDDIDPLKDDPAGGPDPVVAHADDVFVRDRLLGTTTLLSADIDGAGAWAIEPTISGDGSTVAFSGNGQMAPGATSTSFRSIWVADVASGTVRQASIDAWDNAINGWQPAITDDGNEVVFLAGGYLQPAVVPELPSSTAGQLYARDLTADTTTLVTVVDPDDTFVTEDREPQLPSISSDGRYVSFQCWCQRVFDGPNAGMHHLGTYRIDRDTGDFIEIDANLAGEVGNQDVSLGALAGAGKITGDGSEVVYVSAATNLVPGDTNGLDDVYVTKPIVP